MEEADRVLLCADWLAGIQDILMMLWESEMRVVVVGVACSNPH